MIRKTALQLMIAGIVLFTPILAPAQQDVDINALADSEAAIAAIESFNQQSIGGMAGLVIIILGALVFATLRERRKQDLLARFADKGQQIPRELLPPAPSQQREMRRGVWILSLGLGLGLVLYIATRDWAVAAWSLILLFLGVASFINAAFFYSNSNSEG